MNNSYVDSFASIALPNPAEEKELDYLKRLAHRLKAATKKLHFEQEKASEGSAVSNIGRIRQYIGKKIENGAFAMLDHSANFALAVLTMAPVKIVVPSKLLDGISKGLGVAFIPKTLTGLTGLNDKFNVKSMRVSTTVAEHVNDYIDGHVYAAEQTAKNLVRTFEGTANNQQKMFGPWRPETQSLVEELVSGRIQPEQFETAFSDRLLAFNDITGIDDAATQEKVHITTPERVVKIRDNVNEFGADPKGTIETDVKILVFNVKAATQAEAEAEVKATIAPPAAEIIAPSPKVELFRRAVKNIESPIHLLEEGARHLLKPKLVPAYS